MPASASAGMNTLPLPSAATQRLPRTMPIIHLVFANLKTWLIGIHHGVSHQHLQAYLNEFTFRFNRRFYPFNAFRPSASLAMSAHRPSMNSIQGNGSTLHVVGCVNRIGKEQASYERFLASVREAFSSTMANRSVGDVVFSPLLGDVEELNVWIEKRHPWAIGALSVVSRRIPMPEWVADREREVKLALSQGKCPKSRLSDRDDLFGINDVV